MFTLEIQVIIDTTDKGLNQLDDTLVEQGVAILGEYFNNNFGGCFITVGQGFWEGSFEERYIVSTIMHTDAEDWTQAIERKPLFDTVAEVRDLLNQSGVYTVIRQAPGFALCI